MCILPRVWFPSLGPSWSRRWKELFFRRLELAMYQQSLVYSRSCQRLVKGAWSLSTVPSVPVEWSPQTTQQLGWECDIGEGGTGVRVGQEWGCDKSDGGTRVRVCVSRVRVWHWWGWGEGENVTRVKVWGCDKYMYMYIYMYMCSKS